MDNGVLKSSRILHTYSSTALKKIEMILTYCISLTLNMSDSMDCQLNDCSTCGDMHGSAMTYCGEFLTPHQVTEMDCSDTESTECADSQTSELSEPPPPPRLQRQNAYDGAAEQFTTPPRQYTEPMLPRHNVEPRRMSVREQELRFIEENGLVAFCHGEMITAILQDIDYLRAQLFYLRNM